LSYFFSGFFLNVIIIVHHLSIYPFIFLAISIMKVGYQRHKLI